MYCWEPVEKLLGKNSNNRLYMCLSIKYGSAEVLAVRYLLFKLPMNAT